LLTSLPATGAVVDVWPGLTRRLEGRVVALEPLEARHEAGLLEASRHPEIWTWLSGQMLTVEQFGRWFHAALDAAAQGVEGPFATVERASGRVVGASRYLSLRPEHRGLEVGWTWLEPGAWRTGANVEAKLLMLEHAFERLDCLRVEFKTDARNERSRAALAALPAQFEGVFRRHMVTPYGLRDSAYYSVIADDWPAVRDNLRARLADKLRGGD
jgi:RimJ/RimL family protein N-acetyltransferase